MTMDAEEIYSKKFLPGIMKWGALLLWVGLVFSFAPSMYLLFHGIFPGWAAIGKGFGLGFAAVGVMWFVEPFSYFPVLGIPGTYLAFLSGNISNLKLPCTAVSQEAAGVEGGTSQGGIIATIAMVVATIVATVLIFIGAVGLASVVKYFPPFLIKATTFVLPAIFGAIFGQFLLSNVTLGIIALAIAITLTLVKVIPGWGILVITIVAMIIISRVLFQKGLLGKSKSKE